MVEKNYSTHHSITHSNRHDSPNYYPNRFDDIEAEKDYKEPPMQLDDNEADAYDRNKNDDDHYTQPGNLFRIVMTDKEKQNTVNNLIASMSGITGDKGDEIIQTQLTHFYKADKELALKIAKGLNFNFKS